MDKYITKDEFLKATGIDLDLELQDDDDNSNKVNRFIQHTTDWCIMNLTKKYMCADLLNWDKLIEVRQEWFRKGVIEQMTYILRNGLISLDSGYDPNTRTILNFENIKMGDDAYQCFWQGGFCNVPTGGINPWRVI